MPVWARRFLIVVDGGRASIAIWIASSHWQKGNCSVCTLHPYLHHREVRPLQYDSHCWFSFLN